MQIKNTAQNNVFWRMFKKIFCWVIPSVILAYIFYSIEMNKLLQVVKMVNPWLMTLGVSIFPVIVFVGACRWKIIMTRYLNHDVSTWFAAHHYWIGLAIGKFSPASVAFDIYRIIVAGKKFGDYTFQAIAILLEKIVALIVAILLAFFLFPFIKNNITDNTYLFHLKALFFQFFDKNNFLTLFAAVIIILLIVLVAGYLSYKWLQKTGIKCFEHLVLPLFKLKLTLLLLVSSFGIFLLSALGHYYFFCSLNMPLPFIVHFFLMPVFAVLLLLPFTVAGFGIREGSFIIFYGLFGVPMETALIAAFMNLIANLLICIIGGLILLATTSKLKHIR